MNNDIRWIQRLANFENAMTNLRDGVEEASVRTLNKLEKLTTHTYDEHTAEKIFTDIRNKYYIAFKELLDSLLREKKFRNG